MYDNDYSVGSKIVLSPDQESSIKNQYKRYIKALEYTPDSVKFVSTKEGDGLLLDARFLRRDSEEFTADTDAFTYRVTAREITSATTALFSSVYAIEVDGRKIESIGRYYYTLPNNKVLTKEELELAQGKGIDGQYTVLNDEGQSIALVTNIGEIVPIGKPEEVASSIAIGTAIGYRCTCPDYVGQQANLMPTSLGEQQKVFGVLGSRGICKHVYAVRLIRGDVVSIPSAPPSNDGDTPPPAQWSGIKEFKPSRARKGKIKWY
jgi:hypothetical protein